MHNQSDTRFDQSVKEVNDLIAQSMIAGISMGVSAMEAEMKKDQPDFVSVIARLRQSIIRIENANRG